MKQNLISGFAFALMSLNTVEEVILLFLLPEDKADVKGLYWVLKARAKE